MYKSCLLLVILVFVHQIESRGGRGGGGGGSRLGGRGGSSGSRHNSGSYHPPSYNTGHQTGSHDTFHQSSVYQTGNSNSRPVAPIGFENVNQRLGSQNNNHQSIGFENVHNRLPPGNVPAGSYQPGMGGAPNTHFSQPGYNNQPHGYYGTASNPHLGQSGGGYHNPNFGQPGTYYNPHYGVPQQVYQTVPVQQSSGGSNLLGYAGSLGGGYLLGRLTSGGHSSQDNQYNVHHYYHNNDAVPKKISASSNNLLECSQKDTQGLCVPNTFPMCFTNGTIMCVTHILYVVPCGMNISTGCIVTVSNKTTDNSTPANSTALNSTITNSIALNGTALNSTTLNSTAANSTALNSTPANSTALNSTAANSTTLNSTAANSTALNSTALNSTITNSTASNSTNSAVYIPCISNITVIQSNSNQASNRVEYCVTAIAEPKQQYFIAQNTKQEVQVGKSPNGQGRLQNFASSWAYVLIILLGLGTI